MKIPDAITSGAFWRVLRREDGSLWELGRGALGVTYKGVNLHTDQLLAIKVVPEHVLGSDAARKRFLDLLRVARRLDRPHSPRISFVDRQDNTFVYGAEFIAGETLVSLVQRRGPLPPAEALDLLLQAAQALSTLHAAGLVHRDIKPQNILLSPEETADARRVKLIDIGFAKGALEGLGNDEETDGLQTTMGIAPGIPTYLSPEGIDGGATDIRSDLYCLGLVLWFLLAGKPPFADGVVPVVLGHLKKPPPFEVFSASQGPPPVRALLERLLAKDRAARPQNPAELCREITLIQANLLPSLSAECPCLEGGPVDCTSQSLGIDPTAGRAGEVTLRTCRVCRRRWLHYLAEYEAFPRSGRWILGLLPETLPLPLTAENAVTLLDGLPWHFYGGSFFDLPPPGRRGTGRVPADLFPRL